MYFSSRLLKAGLWLGLCSLTAVRAADPVPPSQDPWYTAPEGFEKAAPGTVLRTRPTPGDLPSIIGNTSVSYNVLYRTTDSHSNPSWAVATLLVPQYVPTDAQNRSLISYQLAYDTPAADWAPSYALYKGVSTVPIEKRAVSKLLSRGWFVTIPDYEGPLGAFGAGFNAGHTVLDGLRACASLRDIMGTEAANVKLALWGYSGGAHASAWAAELQEQYAPDLHITGAAIGGLPSNIFTVSHNTNKSPLSGLIVSMSVGIVAEFPEANETLWNSLHQYGLFNREGYYSSKTRHLLSNYHAYYDQNIANYFKDNVMPFEIPILKELVQTQSTLGNNGVPKMAYFLYGSQVDLITGVKDTDMLVDKYCAGGANIEYQRNAIGDHLAEAISTESKAIDFFQGVFEGSYHQVGCKIQNITFGAAHASKADENLLT